MLDSFGLDDLAHMFDSIDPNGVQNNTMAHGSSVFNVDDFAAAIKMEEDDFNLIMMTGPVAAKPFQPLTAPVLPAACAVPSSKVSILESESEDVDYEEEEDEEEEYEPEFKRVHRRKPAARASASSLVTSKAAPAAPARSKSSTFHAPSPVAKVSRDQATINRAERIRICREKKLNRTFEKTIRYETRKAYAEVRPRIKGRFVKGPELEAWKAAQAAGQAAQVLVA